MSANEDYTTPQRTTEKSVPIIRKICHNCRFRTYEVHLRFEFLSLYIKTKPS